MSTFYTCAVHPDVCKLELASCPSCGAALRAGSSAALERAEIRKLGDLAKRFVCAALFSLPVLLLSLGARVPPLAAYLSPSVRGWLQLALAAPVCLWAAWPFYARAAHARRNRGADMFTLIALGVSVAYAYSALAWILPAAFPPAFLSADGQLPAYFGMASMIVTLLLLGQVLEIAVVSQTSGALQSLRDASTRVRRVGREDGADYEIPLERIKIGDRVRVLPGERVPVDGVVTEGSSGVDESVLSGEPRLVTKRPGDELIGGTLNTTGSLVMKVHNLGEDALLACIVERVAAAQQTPAALQGRADALARFLVRGVLGGAAVSFAAWAMLGPERGLAAALLCAIAVVIVASPYAIVLATPLSMRVAMGRGARMGVVFRSAEELERLAAVDTLIVDTTATLTEGRPTLIKLLPARSWDEDELLRLAASLERASSHPFALGLARAARDRELSLGEPRELRFATGKGFTGIVDQHHLALGSTTLLSELGVDVRALAEAAEPLCREGHSVIHLAVDGAPAGSLVFADAIRPSTVAAVQALQAQGVEIILVTSDVRDRALALAGAAGIREVISEVLPLEKVDVVRRMQSEGRTVAMAGRGLDDVRALAQAHVGIALGSAGDLELERAAITLVRGDLCGIARATRLAHRTLTTARQSLVFALAYNLVALPIAAGALYPLLGWLLHPTLAAAATAASSVAVMANSLRLRNVEL